MGPPGNRERLSDFQTGPEDNEPIRNEGRNIHPAHGGKEGGERRRSEGRKEQEYIELTKWWLDYRGNCLFSLRGRKKRRGSFRSLGRKLYTA